VQTSLSNIKGVNLTQNYDKAKRKRRGGQNIGGRATTISRDKQGEEQKPAVGKAKDTCGRNQYPSSEKKKKKRRRRSSLNGNHGGREKKGVTAKKGADGTLKKVRRRGQEIRSLGRGLKWKGAAGITNALDRNQSLDSEGKEGGRKKGK